MKRVFFSVLVLMVLWPAQGNAIVRSIQEQREYDLLLQEAKNWTFEVVKSMMTTNKEVFDSVVRKNHENMTRTACLNFLSTFRNYGFYKQIDEWGDNLTADLSEMTLNGDDVHDQVTTRNTDYDKDEKVFVWEFDVPIRLTMQVKGFNPRGVLYVADVEVRQLMPGEYKFQIISWKTKTKYLRGRFPIEYNSKPLREKVYVCRYGDE